MNKPRSLEEVFTMLQQVNSRLEKLEKFDVDLHGRKVVNAGDAVNSQDYTTLNDLNLEINNAILSIVTNGIDTDSAVAGNLVLHKLKHLFTALVQIYTTGGISDLIIGQSSTVDRLRLFYDPATHYGNISTFNGAVYVNLEIEADTLKLNVVANGALRIGGTTSTISFFNGAPAAQQTLSAYTTNSQSGAYAGINNAQAGTIYATVADLNLLRVAYENLRAMCDDLRTKIKNTTLVL